MAKVNEFERAQDIINGFSKRKCSKEATVRYTYSSADELVKNTAHLSDMISHHQQHQRPRLKTLLEYYEAENTNILRGKRRREEHLADNRAIHNFAEYVSGFIQGFLVGIPVKTTYPKVETEEQ